MTGGAIQLLLSSLLLHFWLSGYAFKLQPKLKA